MMPFIFVATLEALKSRPNTLYTWKHHLVLPILLQSDLLNTDFSQAI